MMPVSGAFPERLPSERPCPPQTMHPHRLFSVLAAALLLACCTKENTKFEWGCLQQVEAEERDRAGAEALRFKTVHGLEVVGILSPGRDGRVWVLLNPTAEPYYKQVPADCGYALSKAQIEAISAHTKVSATVLAVLGSHRAGE